MHPQPVLCAALTESTYSHFPPSRRNLLVSCTLCTCCSLSAVSCPRSLNQYLKVTNALSVCAPPRTASRVEHLQLEEVYLLRGRAMSCCSARRARRKTHAERTSTCTSDQCARPPWHAAHKTGVHAEMLRLRAAFWWAHKQLTSLRCTLTPRPEAFVSRAAQHDCVHFASLKLLGGTAPHPEGRQLLLAGKAATERRVVPVCRVRDVARVLLCICREARAHQLLCCLRLRRARGERLAALLQGARALRVGYAAAAAGNRGYNQ
jgi:hypothetical protein